MSCSGRQSVNPNGCCKSDIVGTRCNPNKYWSSPVARGGGGAVVTHIASITLVKVACCVGPCRHDIRWVVPAAHCLHFCLVSWRSFASGGLIFFFCFPVPKSFKSRVIHPGPGVFSSNLSHHTCLEVSYNPGDLGYFSLGVFIWGWSQALQDSGLLGPGLEIPALKEEFTQKLWYHLLSFMPVQSCMTIVYDILSVFSTTMNISGFHCCFGQNIVWTKAVEFFFRIS